MIASLYSDFFFFSSRRRHTRSLRDWSSDVCSSDLDRVSPLPRCRAMSLRAKLRGAANGPRTKASITAARRSLALPNQLTARIIQRRSLIKRQWVVCARSAKGTGARAIPAKTAIVSIIGKDTRGVAATYCDYHTIENVNGISGNNLCARSTQRHIGDEVHRAVTSR